MSTKHPATRRIRVRIDAIVVLDHDTACLPEGLVVPGMYRKAIEDAVRGVKGVAGVGHVEKRVELYYGPGRPQR